MFLKSSFFYKFTKNALILPAIVFYIDPANKCIQNNFIAVSNTVEIHFKSVLHAL